MVEIFSCLAGSVVIMIFLSHWFLVLECGVDFVNLPCVTSLGLGVLMQDRALLRFQPH